MPTQSRFLALFALLGMLALPLAPALAASHREAPLIGGDPKVDATDLYAFVSPERPDTVTLIANYTPFQEPAGGPNFYAFDDTALYEIKVDNDGDAVEDISYQFRFASVRGNNGTFLYNVGPITSLTDANWNVRQTYTLTKVEKGQTTTLGSNLPVPPANVGPKSTPDYPALHAQAVTSLSNGIKSFVGQVDDPFFVELGGLFDLLTIRRLPGNAQGGTDGLAGYNVHALALQVPIADLTSTKTRVMDAKDPKAVIGVWTTASRPGTRVLSTNPAQNTNTGDFVQVSRLGAPLINEVIIPLGQKDIWNYSKPKDDGQFANSVTDPEFSKLLKLLYKIAVPPQGAFGTADQRDDLIAIFLTGLSGLTKSEKAVPSEQLRLNTAIAPAAQPNRMGVIGGDNQGYPNGRRLADDVTDITVRAAAGAVYPLFHPTFTPDATGVQLGDGVDANDASFRAAFPYLALPWSGYESTPHNRVLPTVAPTTPAPAAPMMKPAPAKSMKPAMAAKCTIDRDLRVGLRGADVRCLQDHLRAKGHLRIIESTDYFGALTAAAVMKWKAAAGLPAASGSVDASARASFNMR